MITLPLVTQRIAALHQHDQRAAAARARISRQTQPSVVASTRHQPGRMVVIAARHTQSLLTSLSTLMSALRWA